jgi:hypothetical protein
LGQACLAGAQGAFQADHFAAFQKRTQPRTQPLRLLWAAAYEFQSVFI